MAGDVMRESRALFAASPTALQRVIKRTANTGHGTGRLNRDAKEVLKIKRR